MQMDGVSPAVIIVVMGSPVAHLPAAALATGASHTACKSHLAINSEAFMISGISNIHHS